MVSQLLKIMGAFLTVATLTAGPKVKDYIKHSQDHASICLVPINGPMRLSTDMPGEKVVYSRKSQNIACIYKTYDVDKVTRSRFYVNDRLIDEDKCPPKLAICGMRPTHSFPDGVIKPGTNILRYETVDTKGNVNKDIAVLNVLDW